MLGVVNWMMASADARLVSCVQGRTWLCCQVREFSTSKVTHSCPSCWRLGSSVMSHFAIFWVNWFLFNSAHALGNWSGLVLVLYSMEVMPMYASRMAGARVVSRIGR